MFCPLTLGDCQVRWLSEGFPSLWTALKNGFQSRTLPQLGWGEGGDDQDGEFGDESVMLFQVYFCTVDCYLHHISFFKDLKSKISRNKIKYESAGNFSTLNNLHCV